MPALSCRSGQASHYYQLLGLLPWLRSGFPYLSLPGSGPGKSFSVKPHPVGASASWPAARGEGESQGRSRACVRKEQATGRTHPGPHHPRSRRWLRTVPRPQPSLISTLDLLGPITESPTPGARSLAGLKAQVGPVQVGLPRRHGDRHRGLGTHASHRA